LTGLNLTYRITNKFF